MTVIENERVEEQRVGSGRSPLWRSLGVLALDVAVPVVGFYALQAAGVGLVASLAISSAAAGVRVIWSLVRDRRTDAVALFVLVVTAISIPVSFIVGSPRLMLAKEELGVPPMGLYLLVTGLRGRTAMTEMFRPWLARTAAADGAFARLLAVPGGVLGRQLCRAQIVYGLAFLLTSAVRLTLIFTLPVTTAVWASGLALPVGIVVAIAAATPFTARAAAAVDAEVAR
ncbi:VC0807 family protein [Pseudonocardia endophytica]|uniref:Intracellular septation protein A n=1 Tax=Pseudonocardia endophytica TaxID=401976 RepID=A0A4R1HYZ2_PSEEN|nr:VC0807 family protein [Pseudonocardia endophytica]TCK25329.1 hypothetical protein EV378_1133 [Pseudonocardia endophytica]